MLLGLFIALSLSMNHIYTIETLGKELKKEQRIFFTKGLQICKGFTNKNFKYIPVHWDKCQTKSGKLMFVANHTIVNWGPHGIRLSNCSDDINSTVCDCITQVALKVTNTTMEHYHDRGLLGDLTVEWPLLVLELSSINRLGLNNGTSGNLLRAPKNLGLGLDISQGPIIVIETISFIIINHISYKLVLPFLLF